MDKQRDELDELIDSYFEHAYMAGSMDEQSNNEQASMNSRKCFELRKAIQAHTQSIVREARLDELQRVKAASKDFRRVCFNNVAMLREYDQFISTESYNHYVMNRKNSIKAQLNQPRKDNNNE